VVKHGPVDFIYHGVPLATVEVVYLYRELFTFGLGLLPAARLASVAVSFESGLPLS